jgi:hypothetical protein
MQKRVRPGAACTPCVNSRGFRPSGRVCRARRARVARGDVPVVFRRLKGHDDPPCPRPSGQSCASASACQGNRRPISKPGHPASSAAFDSRASAAKAASGKSSLPRKNTRRILNSSSQNGASGSPAGEPFEQPGHRLGHPGSDAAGEAGLLRRHASPRQEGGGPKRWPRPRSHRASNCGSVTAIELFVDGGVAQRR